MSARKKFDIDSKEALEGAFVEMAYEVEPRSNLRLQAEYRKAIATCLEDQGHPKEGCDVGDRIVFPTHDELTARFADTPLSFKSFCLLGSEIRGRAETDIVPRRF